MLQANGLRIRHLPVDEEGMQVPQEAGGEPPRFIFVTPSHQYPLGPVMSLARRRQLLARAAPWQLDHRGRLRQRVPLLGALLLLGLEPDAPVIYMGTFSKTLYPGLRVGYLVLPRRWWRRSGGTPSCTARATR